MKAIVLEKTMTKTKFLNGQKCTSGLLLQVPISYILNQELLVFLLWTYQENKIDKTANTNT